MDTGICNADIFRKHFISAYLYIFSINHMFTSVRYKVATADYLSSKVELAVLDHFHCHWNLWSDYTVFAESITILIRIKAHGEVKVSQLFPCGFRCISVLFVLDIPNDPSRQDRWTGREVVVQALDQR